MVDGLALLLEHPETRGIILIGEIGGNDELKAAELITQHRGSSKNPKPVVAMVGGRTAPVGRMMGHAGAVLSPEDVSASMKTEALEQAGAVIVPHPGVMGEVMKGLLR